MNHNNVNNINNIDNKILIKIIIINLSQFPKSYSSIALELSNIL